MNTYDIMPKFPTHWFKPIVDEWMARGSEVIDFHQKNPKGRFFPKDETETFEKDFDWISAIIGFNKENLHIGVRNGISNGKARPHFESDEEFQQYVDLVKLGEGYCTFNLFVAYPGRIDPLHIDSSRSCAINFAVDVDHDKSYFRISESLGIEGFEELDLPEEWKYPKWRKYAHDDKKRGWFDESKVSEDKILKYDLKSPIIFHCKTPHGGANHNDKTRTIFSIGFRKPKQEIMKHLPKEWFEA